jgi:hypothetical protein
MAAELYVPKSVDAVIKESRNAQRAGGNAKNFGHPRADNKLAVRDYVKGNVDARLLDLANIYLSITVVTKWGFLIRLDRTPLPENTWGQYRCAMGKLLAGLLQDLPNGASQIIQRKQLAMQPLPSGAASCGSVSKL